MIDRNLIVCGDIGDSGIPVWQTVALSSSSSTLESLFSDKAIDLSSLRDIAVGAPIFLNVLVKSSVVPAGMRITPEILGASYASLLDWSVISTGRAESLSGMASRGFVSIPLDICSSTYRYLFARFSLEAVAAVTFFIFAYFSNVPVLESKSYASGWSIK